LPVEDNKSAASRRGHCYAASENWQVKYSVFLMKTLACPLLCTTHGKSRINRYRCILRKRRSAETLFALYCLRWAAASRLGRNRIRAVSEPLPKWTESSVHGRRGQSASPPIGGLDWRRPDERRRATDGCPPLPLPPCPPVRHAPSQRRQVAAVDAPTRIESPCRISAIRESLSTLLDTRRHMLTPDAIAWSQDRR
jgi:hypothetical protein